MARSPKSAAAAPARDLERDMVAAQILRRQLEECYGDEEADAQLLRDMIEGETGLFEAVDRVLGQIAFDQATIEGIKRFETTVAARKKRLEGRVETLRTLLLNALDIVGDRTMERPLATITAKPVAPSLTVTDEARIPTVYFKTKDPELDRKKLTDALKEHRNTLEQKLAELSDKIAAGEIPDVDAAAARERLIAAFPPIPGAELGNGGTALQIRFS